MIVQADSTPSIALAETREARRRLKVSPLEVVVGTLVFLIVAAALIGPLIAPASIYESNIMKSLERPSALLDDRGQASDLWVRDISFKGVLLEVRGRREAPSHFKLRFAAADIPPIGLHGVLRRRIGPRLAAYDLSHSPAEEIERLREYILQAHRQAHPELHAQAPAAC